MRCKAGHLQGAQGPNCEERCAGVSSRVWYQRVGKAASGNAVWESAGRCGQLQAATYRCRKQCRREAGTVAGLSWGSCQTASGTRLACKRAGWRLAGHCSEGRTSLPEGPHCVCAAGCSPAAHRPGCSVDTCAPIHPVHPSIFTQPPSQPPTYLSAPISALLAAGPGGGVGLGCPEHLLLQY